MRPAIRQISALMLLVISVSLNIHLPVMQVVAWSSMLIQFSRDGSVSEAAGKTFSGENPCGMCYAIQQARDDAAGTRHDPGSICSRESVELCGLLVIRLCFIGLMISDFSVFPSASPLCSIGRSPPLLPPPISFPG